MKKNLYAFLLTFCLGCSVFAGIPLPDKIVYTPEEEGAARELKDHLEQIDGRKYSMVKESGAEEKGPCIYVGNTSFARKNDCDFSRFASEEWLVVTKGNNLVIGGGKESGTLYGVYDFLEKQLGCHWFSFDCTYIPVQKNIVLPELKRRGKPDFESRYLFVHPHMVGIKAGSPAMFLYLKRNRMHCDGEEPRAWRLPKRTSLHTFYEYVQPDKYFKEHPEYFSMNEKGERFLGTYVNHNGSNLCLSNPEVRKITLDSLREYIRKDRASLPEKDWPGLYDLSQMDGCDFICKCPKCKAISEKYGSDAGLLLEYVNYVAKEIAKEYPDIRIRTFAYCSSDKAPKNIRPAENVVIRWVDVYTSSDCYRPLSHPVNSKRKQLLDEWNEVNAPLLVWDYWNMDFIGSRHCFEPPRVETVISAIGPDVRYFKKIGVKGLFVEAETFYHRNPQNFYELQAWLLLQLMVDSTQDEQKLIDTFMNGYYGPAAPYMSRFLKMIQDGIASDPSPYYYIACRTRKYADAAFLEKAYALLKQAQAAVPENSPYRLRVNKEMITPIAVILSDSRMKTNLNREALISEYTALRKEQFQHFCSPQRWPNFEKDLAQTVELFHFDMPRPEFFKNVPEDKIVILGYPNFIFFNRKTEDMLKKDPDSPMSKSLYIGEKDQNFKDGFIHNPVKTGPGGLTSADFGVFDNSSRKSIMFRLSELPADEKYHWYRIGKFDVFSASFIWAFYWRAQIDIASVYSIADGIADYNVYDAWISVKFTGPAYVKGSQKENAIWIDYAALVKPGFVSFVQTEKIQGKTLFQQNFKTAWTPNVPAKNYQVKSSPDASGKMMHELTTTDKGKAEFYTVKSFSFDPHGKILKFSVQAKGHGKLKLTYFAYDEQGAYLAGSYAAYQKVDSEEWKTFCFSCSEPTLKKKKIGKIRLAITVGENSKVMLQDLEVEPVDVKK